MPRPELAGSGQPHATFFRLEEGGCTTGIRRGIRAQAQMSARFSLDLALRTEGAGGVTFQESVV